VACRLRPAQGKMRKTKPISGGQDIPPFHYSIIPPFQSGADCAKRTQSLDCGLRTADRPAAGHPPCGLPPRARARQLCKTKPIRRPIVRNEPNLARSRPSRGRRRAKCAKRTQFPASRAAGAGRSRQTKPIPAVGSQCAQRDIEDNASRRHYKRRAERAKRSQFAGQSCETNPISRRTRYPMIPLFYHSTIPIRCRLCKTNPIRRDLPCKTNPISRWRIVDWGLRIGNRPGAGRHPCGLPPPAYGGQNAQNKPNSQWTRYPIIPLFYHSTIPVRCRWCRTNPISRRGRVGRGLGDEGRTCKTNPISGGTEWDEGQTCKTNPISERGPICLR
jgi:hypothetical protein